MSDLPIGRPITRRPVGANITAVGVGLALAFGVLAGGAGWWQVVEAGRLTTAPDNPLVIATARTALRGQVVDRAGIVLASNERDANGEVFRVYADQAVSHVVGYASLLFGSAGLERTYAADLVGLRRDPVADLLRKFDPTPADPQDLTLTLSLDLQRAALAGLGADRGAVVMLDPRTGGILALASSPVYDAGGIANPATSRATWAALNADPVQPLLPRATLGRYVPGSVFKIVTAIAGLGSDAFAPDTIFPEQEAGERDGLVVSGFRIREHAGVPVRSYDLAGATEVSSNIYYALAALAVGGDELSDWAGRLGFDAALPFELPTAVSQVTNGGGDFGGGFKDAVELANAGYGQAETFVTPLQMALVAATVANDGVLMRPHLVASFSSAEGGVRPVRPDEVRRVLGADDAAAIVAAMRQAVEGTLGRQFTSGAAIQGIPTAGKSGTAELGGTGEPHSWFIGFAPADDPQIAIAVLVERGGRGGARAAPLAGALMRAYLVDGVGR
ncbi:MAG TPA: penicillin-binding transpeptidase domain-containing protein [Candidatus Limnocylindrales bacterium]|nr:penicillin-binding transpeptidase domain-containing protein [Candidatus Limnocylindrales bacterium]